MLNITQNEKLHLRELARKVAQYASLPVMEERRQLWYAHNELRAERPPVIMEMYTFMGDMMPALKCENEAARNIEWELLFQITNHELIDDDKVVPAFFPVNWQIHHKRLGIDQSVNHAIDAEGRDLAHRPEAVIKDLKADLHLLKASEYSVDRQATADFKAFVDDTIGDILPSKLKNSSLQWHFVPTAIAVNLMGMESLLIAMLDYPSEFHQMMKLICDDSLNYLKWQQDEGILELNNDNDYVGAGSYGFTDQLPKSKEYAESRRVTSQDLWMNTNSQESVGLSPEMYAEFIFPYYEQMAAEFGLVYYGCCEAVHSIWDNCLSRLPNLRKVSVSHWCDEEFMGNRLRGKDIIYSRKPSPNFIGVGDKLDEQAFSEYIKKTLIAAKDCHLEFIFRDIYTLNGDTSKPGQAVKIVRQLIDEMWNQPAK